MEIEGDKLQETKHFALLASKEHSEYDINKK